MSSSQEIEQKQDEVLDDISRTLDRLHDIGTTINTTLIQDQQILSDLDGDTEDLSSALTRANRKIQELEKTKGCKIARYSTIVILFIFAIILCIALIM